MSDSVEKGAPTKLPVVAEHHPKGITVYPDGSSQEVHVGYTVLRAGPILATATARVPPSIEHVGGNAEDCPACGPDTPYPWVCPGSVAPPD